MAITKTYPYTGIRQTFVVPPGCTTVHFNSRGGGGGSGTGGPGDTLSGDIAVTPGDILYIRTGGAGGPATAPGVGGVGGYPDGGHGGNALGSGGLSGEGGGGSSEIRLNTDDLAHRIAIAAGGGGSGRPAAFSGGGDGERPTGVSGGSAGDGGAGQGGTAAAGGVRGTPGAGASDSAADGALGQGGHGSNHSGAGLNGGGGGGGGKYGGGGGGGGATSSGGAGGGSSYYDPAHVSGIGGSTPTPAATNGLHTLTYTKSPNQPALLSPVGGDSVDLTAAIAATVAFSSDDPAVTLASLDVRWRVGAGAWTTITAASTTSVYDFPANTFLAEAGQTIEWQAKTTDDLGGVSDWSDSGFFVPTTPPAAPTIVSAVIASVTPLLFFTTVDSQLACQAQAGSDVAGSFGAVLADTGVIGVAGNGSPAFIPAYAYVNGTDYHLRVRYQHVAGVWSPWADSGPVAASINSPLAPTAVVTAMSDTASVLIQIDNPGSDPHPPTHNDVYRTDPATGVETRIATEIAVGGSYTDWKPVLNRAARYRVVAVTADGAFTSSP